MSFFDTFTQQEKDCFFNTADSLRKYRRAELFEEGTHKNLVKELYVDPERDEHVFHTMMATNTTFLIGRKGTGKSTIFARCQHEIRETTNKISTYHDVKTLHGTAQSSYLPATQQGKNLDKFLVEKYLIHREFLRNVLSEIRSEFRNRIKSSILQRIKDSALSSKLESMTTDLLKEVETPQFDDLTLVKEVAKTLTDSTRSNIGAKAAASPEPLSISSEVGSQSSRTDQFTNIYLRYFNIKKFLEDVQTILNAVGIEHLFIFFDDFSELDKEAMKLFVDVILAPLNNWSNEFIKLKVAAYPGRVYLGDIDIGKIDQIHIDFFDLYGVSDRYNIEEKAEEKARDYTKRILEKRIGYFSQNSISIEKYFDRANTMDFYYDLLFKLSMNVPRIMGFILHYAYSGTIGQDKVISKSVLESAAERYFADKMEASIAINRFTQETFEEKIDSFQQFELLGKLIEKAKEAKRHIASSKSATYEDIRNPPTSHFYVRKAYEDYLRTLELNFFIHKYREMTDKDGAKSTVYAINYGQCVHENILWGRPQEGVKYSKYFMDRIFDRNTLVQEQLESAKIIRCVECSSVFPYSMYERMSAYDMLCLKCKKGSCVVEHYGEKFKQQIASYAKEDLLPRVDLEILQLLNIGRMENRDLYATPLSEELDTSTQLIGARVRILSDKQLVERVYKNLPRVGERHCYFVTDSAVNKYFS